MSNATLAMTIKPELIVPYSDNYQNPKGDPLTVSND